MTEQAQAPLKFSFCPRCCESFTTQSVNAKGGLKLLPDLRQHLKAMPSFKKKITRQSFSLNKYFDNRTGQELWGRGTLSCNPLLVLERKQPPALKTKATLTILWPSVGYRTAAPHGSNDAAHPFNCCWYEARFSQLLALYTFPVLLLWDEGYTPLGSWPLPSTPNRDETGKEG